MNEIKINLNTDTKAKKQIELDVELWNELDLFIKFLERTDGKAKGKKLEKYSNVISQSLKAVFESNAKFKEYYEKEQSKENKSAQTKPTEPKVVNGANQNHNNSNNNQKNNQKR
ncbi:MAG: hypothetical protein H9W80_08970 [Enterococcus sp.]|nr:hypothetical protein [Enterococcus sp.]